MLRFYAETFVAFTRMTTEICSLLKAWEEDHRGEVLPAHILHMFSEKLQILSNQLEIVWLPVTLQSMRTLQEAVRLKDPNRQLIPLLNEVQDILQYELVSMMFFKIPNELTEYYQDHNELFGEQVSIQFPSAKYDISEAGKCLALGRNTACVFHLMRVLEIGLTALGNVFGISLSHTNWHPAIEQIEKKIREMGADPNRGATWKDDQEFYAQAASYVMVIKDAWRNYTAHARGKYDEQEAEMILRNVQAFMQKLATRLSE